MRILHCTQEQSHAYTEGDFRVQRLHAQYACMGLERVHGVGTLLIRDREQGYRTIKCLAAISHGRIRLVHKSSNHTWKNTKEYGILHDEPIIRSNYRNDSFKDNSVHKHKGIPAGSVHIRH